MFKLLRTKKKSVIKVTKLYLTRLTVGLVLFSLFISLHPAPTVLAQEATQSAQTASSQEPPTNTLPQFGEKTVNTNSNNVSKQSETSARAKPKVRIKRLLKRDFRVGEKILVDFENARPQDIQAKVLDNAGLETQVRIQEIIDGNFLTLKISSGSTFKPGNYRLQIRTRDGKVSEQDFTWGVLAINVNKPIFQPGETAKIALAVLDEKGEMDCDAVVKLEVRSPKSEVTVLSTQDQTIKVNEECTKKQFTLTPDYETSYQTGVVGNYLMTLSALTKNGFHTVTDSFRVDEAIAFEIEREAPTRIYPPSAYPVKINITAGRDFTGTVKEIVPTGFTISPLDGTPTPSEPEFVSVKDLPLEGELPNWAVLSLPFEGDFPVIAEFGQPVTNPTVAEKFADSRVLANDGLDFAVPASTEVLATDSGEVVLARQDGAYGVTVVIQHEWGKSYYGYLGELRVKTGDKVTREQVIALSGSSLAETPQLHFGIKPNKNNRDNGYFGKIDPAAYLGLKEKRQVVEEGSDLQVQLISWNLSVKKGQTITLGYNFLAPKVSPAFYTLGRLSFINSNNRQVFKESRFWQIASDAATYTGKHLRTVEYVLGTGGLTCNTSNNACGSDTNASARASATPVYFGNQVNTTKGTASTKNIIIQGSGIRVVQAYLEGWVHMVSAADVTNFDLRLDVEGSSTAGSDSRLSEASGLTMYDNSGPNSTIRFRGDATYLFDRQSDTDFNNGLSVVGAYTVTGPTTILGSMKLIITYEQNYSTTAHDETKTVRFPLDSTAGSDNGTKNSACAGSATCGFAYNANIPDAVADGDIMDVFFEVTGEVNSATASTIQPQISGGTAARTYPWLDVIAGQQFVNIYFRPAVGGSDFARSTSQTLNIVNGSVAVQGLGGELVVTYNYSTDEASQTETVRYFVRQETGQNVGSSQSANSAVSATVSNTGMTMSNIWVKADSATNETTTLTLSGDVAGTVDGSADITNAVALGGTDSIRAGDTATLYLDLSGQAGDFSSATTSTDIERQYSGTVGDAALSMELFLTFTWDGDGGGTVTKTVTFGGNQQGVGDSAASAWRNKPMYLELPETVTKTHRSTYIGANVGHSNATSITDSATISIGVNNTTAPANQTTATEQQEDGTTTTEENSVFTVRHDVTNTIFSGGATISWTKRTFEVNATISAGEPAWISHEFVVTYDAALGANDPAAPAQPKHLRTIEYVLGTGGLTCNTSNNACGSDTNASARASATPVYFGNQVNTTKGTASTKNIIIQGSGIRVVQAYLEGWVHVVTSADVTNFDLRLDVEGSSTAGTDSRLQEAAGSTLIDTSGLNNTIRFRGDATYLFDRQSDTDFNNGLSVVGAYTVTGPTTILGSMKLIITYEQNYSTTAHDETKTVRFPLDSTAGSDNGTKNSACAGSATCGFAYNANIPDAVADGDIMDVFFEITGETNTTTATTIQPQISGGTAARTYPWLDTVAGQQFVNIYFRPAVGGSDFARSTSQTLNIVNGSVAVQGLGGELVVTYNYSTDEASQTETVRYFVRQETGQNVGSSQSANSAVSATVSNTGMTMSNIWVKADAAVSESVTLTLSGDVAGTVDGSADITNAVALGGSDTIRAGDTATLYLDLSAQAGDFSSATTSTDIERQYSGTSGDAAVSMEMFLTFTWDGDGGGTVTKTVTFGTNQQGSGDSAASVWRNKPVTIELPETVTKTHRSTYIGTNLLHSDATSIVDSSTQSIGVNNTTPPANQTTTTEQQEEGAVNTTEESALFTIRHDVTNTIFSGGATISWTRRTFEVNATINQAEPSWYSHEFVVTYDAELDPIVLAQNHFRWRDDSTALNTSGGYLASEDALPTINKLTTVRVRVEIANTGGAPALDYPFQLEFAARTGGTCGDETFAAVPVTPTSEHFEMVTSSQYADQAATSASLLTATGTFSNGRGVEDPANQTVAIDITNGNYTEVEFAVQATNSATNSATYCFRLTNVGSTTNFTYTTYAQVTIAAGAGPTLDQLMRHGKWLSAGTENPFTF